MIDNSIKTSAQDVLAQLNNRRVQKSGAGDTFGSLLDALDSAAAKRQQNLREVASSAQQPVRRENARQAESQGEREPLPVRPPVQPPAWRPNENSALEHLEKMEPLEKTEKTGKTESAERSEKTAEIAPKEKPAGAAETAEVEESAAATENSGAAENPDEVAAVATESAVETLPTDEGVAGVAEETVAVQPLADAATVVESAAAAVPATTAVGGKTASEVIKGEALMQDIKASSGQESQTVDEVLATLADGNGEVSAEEAATSAVELAENLQLGEPDAAATRTATGAETGQVAATVGVVLGDSTASLQTPSTGAAKANSALNGVAGAATANAASSTQSPAAAPLAAPVNAPTVAQTPAAPNTPVPVTNLSQQLFDQMQNQLHRLKALGQGEHQLKLAINPESFGPVRLAVHFHADGTASLQMLAASEAAREQIKQILSDLRRDLAATGLTGQLDLAEDASDFARFAGEAGAQTGEGDGFANAGTTGPSGQDAGGSDTPNEAAYVVPTVGTVLKDGSDGTVDRFA